MPKGIYKRKSGHKMSKKALAHKKLSLIKKIHCKNCNIEFVRNGFGHKFCNKCSKNILRQKRRIRARKHYFIRKKENPRHCVICSCVIGDYRKYCKKCLLKHQRNIRKERDKKRYNCSEKKRKQTRRRRLKLRVKIFNRDNFTCVFCGKKPPEVILQIDHIKPKSKGGKNNEKNYQTLCKECNIGKGDMILNEF